MGCRLWDFIPAQFTGPPDWYIIHAWGAAFQDTVATLVHELSPPPPVNSAAESEIDPLLASIFVWIGAWEFDSGALKSTVCTHMPLLSIHLSSVDTFAVDHSCGNRAVSEATELVEYAVATCSKGESCTHVHTCSNLLFVILLWSGTQGLSLDGQ